MAGETDQDAELATFGGLVIAPDNLIDHGEKKTSNAFNCALIEQKSQTLSGDLQPPKQPFICGAPMAVSSADRSLDLYRRAAFEDILADVITGRFLHLQMQAITVEWVRARQILVDLDPRAEVNFHATPIASDTQHCPWSSWLSLR